MPQDPYRSGQPGFAGDKAWGRQRLSIVFQLVDGKGSRSRLSLQNSATCWSTRASRP